MSLFELTPAVSRRAGTRAASAVLVACVALGACKKGGYVEHPDSGGAGVPPAAHRDASETPQAPESTTGISRNTGKPGVSGDTTGRSKATQSPPMTPAPAPQKKP
jgi:hypothetical protein